MSWFWQPLLPGGAALSTTDTYLTGASPPPHIRILVRQPRRLIIEDEQLAVAAVAPRFDEESHQPRSWSPVRLWMAPRPGLVWGDEDIPPQPVAPALDDEGTSQLLSAWKLPRVAWVFWPDEEMPVALEEDSWRPSGWLLPRARPSVESEEWPAPLFGVEDDLFRPSQWPPAVGRVFLEHEEYVRPFFLTDESEILPGYRLSLRWRVVGAGFYQIPQAPAPLDDPDYTPPPPWPEYIIVAEEQPESLGTFLGIDDLDPYRSFPSLWPIPSRRLRTIMDDEDDRFSTAPTLGIEDETWLARDRWPVWKVWIVRETDQFKSPFPQTLGIEDETWRPIVRYRFPQPRVEPELQVPAILPIPIQVDDEGDWFMQQTRTLCYRTGWIVRLYQDDEADRGGFSPPPATSIPYHWRWTKHGVRRPHPLDGPLGG